MNTAPVGRSVYRKKTQFLVCSSAIWAHLSYLKTSAVMFETPQFSERTLQSRLVFTQDLPVCSVLQEWHVEVKSKAISNSKGCLGSCVAPSLSKHCLWFVQTNLSWVQTSWFGNAGGGDSAAAISSAEAKCSTTLLTATWPDVAAHSEQHVAEITLSNLRLGQTGLH